MAGFADYTDSELVNLLKEGNPMAFNEVYNRYWEKLYIVAHRIIKEQEGAEEVVQDVFLMLWNKRLQLDIQTLRVYLAAMTRYEVYRYMAKDRKQRVHETNYHDSLPESISIDSELENKLLLEIINNLSNHLPEKCRLVFQYVKLQDRSLAETAEELGISQKTAEAHLTKALKVIRKTMGDGMHVFF